MLNLINQYFHLGLHIGQYCHEISSKMFYFIWFNRHTYAIFNPKVSILLIRRVFLFMLIANRFNYFILPIINGFSRDQYDWKSLIENFNNSSNFVKSSCGALDNHKINKKKRVLHYLSFWQSIGKKRRRARFNFRAGIQRYLRYLNSIAFSKYSRGKKKYIVMHYKKNLIRRYRRLVKYLYGTRKRKMNIPFVGFNTVKKNWFISSFISRFFHNYKLPVLLNAPNLVSNWRTYYEYVRAIILPAKTRYYRRSRWLHTFAGNGPRSLQSLQYTRRLQRKRMLNPSIALALRIYYKLSIFVNRNFPSWKSQPKSSNKPFRKFFVFLKLFRYLRQFRALPNILFYLESNATEVLRILKYKVCVIALVNSDCSSIRTITYPIPCNFGNYLSKIFYAHMIVNSFFLGRILLFLTAVC